jgi:hypothetical protein
VIPPPVNEEFDFLNEMEFAPEDAEEGFSEVLDTEDEVEADDVLGVEDAEEDEFGNEFSDNEGFEDEGKPHHGDDY